MTWTVLWPINSRSFSIDPPPSTQWEAKVCRVAWYQVSAGSFTATSAAFSFLPKVCSSHRLRLPPHIGGGIFPNRSSLIRLVGAVLAEISEDWAVVRRYMTPETPAKEENKQLEAAPTKHTNKKAA